MAALGGGKKTIQLENNPYKLTDGKARVTFSKEEDTLLAEKCRMMVVGKFSCTRSQIDRLRDEFKQIFPLRGIIYGKWLQEIL